jgi:glycerol-3-phosphate acyltransferase PlsY
VEISYFTLLVLCAFGLCACPFSLWVGRWLLGKDIRNYGDGNPGAANVFKAGGRKAGFLAVFLDVAKGVPFVFLAHSFFELPEAAVLGIAFSAILGHAFSPILQLKGGKAIAVTFGVVLALPQHDMLFALAGAMLLGFLFIAIDAWVVIFGVAASATYVLITRGAAGETLFMMGVLALLVLKFFDELKTVPRFKLRPIAWLQSRGG